MVVTAAVSSLLTTAWHHAVHRHREIRNHREMCTHVWGPTEGVVHDLAGRPAGHKRWCRACGKQKNVFHNGEDYVPRKNRQDGVVYPDDPDYKEED